MADEIPSYGLTKFPDFFSCLLNVAFPQNGYPCLDCLFYGLSTNGFRNRHQLYVLRIPARQQGRLCDFVFYRFKVFCYQ